MRVGEDLTFRFDVADAATAQPVTDLEPYLGAWAHIMAISQDRREFIHAHPDDDTNSAPVSPWQHTHAVPGPSPSFVQTTTGFRRPGIYRMWVQFQRSGRVITVPFTVNILPGAVSRRNTPPIPAEAIRIAVSSTGFNPARIVAATGKPLRLAFYRQDAQNCASAVVFPELGIRRDRRRAKRSWSRFPRRQRICTLPAE